MLNEPPSDEQIKAAVKEAIASAQVEEVGPSTRKPTNPGMPTGLGPVTQTPM